MTFLHDVLRDDSFCSILPTNQCQLETVIKIFNKRNLLLFELTGAPNGSVPQNICSSGKFLLAG